MLSVYVDNYSINCLLRLKLFDPVKKESFVHLKFDIIPPPVELQVPLIMEPSVYPLQMIVWKGRRQ